MSYNNPVLETVEGIIIEKYAQTVIALSKTGKTDREEILKFVESQGIKRDVRQGITEYSAQKLNYFF